jgi:hypothetical protein
VELHCWVWGGSRGNFTSTTTRGLLVSKNFQTKGQGTRRAMLHAIFCFEIESAKIKTFISTVKFFGAVGFGGAATSILPLLFDIFTK